MGSYDETCAISTLPIGYGDRVRCVFIRQVVAKEDRKAVLPAHYTTDLWCPVAVPVRARYDDEGLLSDYKVGYAERRFLREIGRSETSEAFRVLLEQIRSAYGRFEEPVTYKPRGMGPCILTAVLIHERIYNAMSRIRWLEYHPYERISSRKTIQAAAREFIADMRAEVAKTKTDKERMSLGFRVSGEHYRNAFTMSFGGEGGLQALDYLRQEIVREIIHPEGRFDENDPKTAAFLDDFATLIAVDRSMLHMRKFWSPQTGKGSQDNDTVGYRVLGRAIERHIQRERRQWKAENLGAAPWQRSKYVKQER